MARNSDAAFVNIEVTCSNTAEHQQRVETRPSTVVGLKLPTWNEVEAREYHSWDRAKELALSITFIRADVIDLSIIHSNAFDLVYTGGHVAVWVSDIDAFYSEATRILRPSGLLMINEYHPFRRTWQASPDQLIVAAPYAERGPFEYDNWEQIFRPEPGTLKSYEFHWTIADHINAVLKAGCEPGSRSSRRLIPRSSLPELPSRQALR